MEKIDKIASYIEATLTHPEVTKDDIRQHCENAVRHGFASIVVRGCWVEYASSLLKGSGVNICSGVGPMKGTSLTCVKAAEGAELVKHGATEIDTFVNMGFIKSGLWELAEKDVAAVVESVKSVNPNVPVKVIVENGIQYEADKQRAYLMCKSAGADYIKTNTGYVDGVATVADVKLIRATVGETMKIKAAGHTFDYKILCELIRAGANRIGTTQGLKICAQEALALKNAQ